jgi:hypothetical protein
MGDDVHDLREHIDAAHAAADRLVQEAQRRAEEAVRAQNVPERGWEAPRTEAERGPFAPELATAVALLDAVRHAVPAELSQQLAEALRELLLAVRALIDWYLDRLDRPPATPVEVEDIPID